MNTGYIYIYAYINIKSVYLCSIIENIIKLFDALVFRRILSYLFLKILTLFYVVLKKKIFYKIYFTTIYLFVEQFKLYSSLYTVL